MAEDTKIEWADHTFNPWMGCSKVAEGCRNCYAETLMDTRWGKVQWGPNGTRVRTADANWKKPVSWNRAAEKAGEIKTVFCASLADVFEDWTGPIQDSKGMRICHNGHGLTTSFRDANTPLMDHWSWLTLTDLRADLFRLIDATPHLMWLILTKRPENIREMWPATAWGGKCASFPDCVAGMHRPNVALITSVSTQADADRNIPLLLQCRDLCPVLGVSAEPLVEAVDLSELQYWRCPKCGIDGTHSWSECREHGPMEFGHGIDWVIAGGESGAGARPCRIEWLRDIVEQCKDAGVPVFVKQLGGNPWMDPAELARRRAQPEYRPLRDPKGGGIEEWPEDLRVREFPVWSPASV